jgi:tripartite-type tricarboxylate transporter receptor subunit TctC
VPGYEASAFFGVGAPKGTPRQIVELLNKQVNAALKDPAMIKKLGDLGGIPTIGTPEEFGKAIVDETEKWAKVVHAANLSIN